MENFKHRGLSNTRHFKLDLCCVDSMLALGVRLPWDKPQGVLAAAYGLLANRTPRSKNGKGSWWAEEEEERGRKKVSISGLTGFAGSAGTPGPRPLAARIASLFAWSCPVPLPWEAPRSLLLPLDWLLLYCSECFGCFASVCKRKTFPRIATGPLLHCPQRNEICPGGPIPWLCLAPCKDFISAYFSVLFICFILITYHLMS